MYLGAICYKDEYLAPGSMAYQLHKDKNFKKLDEHLAELTKAKKKLEGK